MLIKKIVLHQYRRLALNNIETLEYTPESHLQIILGSNGSGKSSLIREASPLPANLKKDYKEGGYKHIIIEHNRALYDISSGLLHPGKHSFIVDGLELNTAGIKKIQLELVKEHFKLTPHIHEILLGATKFTSMSPSERKRWLTEISNIDYSYPISVYNKLKQRHRDLTGGIRITQNKLLQDDVKVLDTAMKDKLTTDLVMLKRFVDHLLSVKTINGSTVDTHTLSRLKNTNTQAFELLNVLNDQQYDEASLRDKLASINTTIESNKKQIDKYTMELDKLSRAAVPVDKELHVLESEYVSTKASIAEIVDNNVYGIELANISVINKLYQHGYTDLVSLLADLDQYNDITYDPDILAKLSSEIDANQYEYERLERLSRKLSLEHEKYVGYANTAKVTCVKCTHEWHLNYDAISHTAIQNDLEKYVSTMATLKDAMDKQKKNYDRYVSKRNVIEQIRKFTAASIMLKPIWIYIFSKYTLQTDSAQIATELNKITNVLNSLTEYPNLFNKLNSLDNDIKMSKSNAAIRHELASTSMETLSIELSNLIHANNDLKIEHGKIVASILSMDKLGIIHDELRLNLKNSSKSLKNEIAKVRNDSLNELINLFKYEISVIEKKISDSGVVENNLAETKKTLDDLVAKERNVKLLVKLLSPTEGLIAKSINSFLNLFISDINGVIDTVWTYNLRLLPCEVAADNDLDYTFPVRIDNNEVIEDVSKGSAGIIEIIDLAFKIVFIKYLGLEDYPLYLDEYAVNMDYAHRINAYKVIDKVLSPNFSQVFLISHFTSMYGSLSNTDISVLSPDNLMLDDGMVYNKVLTIK